MSDLRDLADGLTQRPLRRRSFLKWSAAVGVSAAFGSILAACGGDDDDDDGGDPTATSGAATTATTGGGEATATTGSGTGDATATTGTGTGDATATSTAILGGATPTGESEATAGGTLRIGISTNLETPDPHKARTGVQTTYA